MGRLSPNTLRPTPQAWTVHSHRTICLSFRMFIGAVVFALFRVFGPFLSQPQQPFSCRKTGTVSGFSSIYVPGTVAGT